MIASILSGNILESPDSTDRRFRHPGAGGRGKDVGRDDPQLVLPRRQHGRGEFEFVLLKQSWCSGFFELHNNFISWCYFGKTLITPKHNGLFNLD